MLSFTSWMLSAAAPAAVAALAGGIAIALARRSVEPDPSAKSTVVAGSLPPIVLSLGWAAAVTAGLVAQRIHRGDEGPHWWPDEFWQRGYWAIWAAALVMGATAGVRWRDLPFRWVIAGLLAIATAAISVPGGENWADVLPLHQGWIALLAGSCLIGIWSLDRLSATAADRWFPLVVLATLAGPMMLAAATYTALIEWTVAAIAATLPIVLFALLGWIGSRAAVGIAYPAVSFATVMTAAGRFSRFDEQFWWSYLGMLAVPAAVTIVDYPLRGRNAWIRALVAALTASIAIGVSAWLQYRPEDPGAGEW